MLGILFGKIISVRKLTGNTFLGFLLLLGCVDPYLPPSTIKDYSYLVVDGVLNTNDTSIFTLSHTRRIASTDSLDLEAGATISIEEENGKSYTATSDFKGHYSFLPDQVDVTKNLRMNISTPGGNVYRSEYVATIPNPPIDSVSWKITTLNSVPGVQLYANTHDPTNRAKYFLWRYDETWQFYSQFSSDLKQTPAGQIVYRDTLIDECFTSMSSAIVLINSTAGLSEDIVLEFPLLHIALSSPRVETRYSMLVHQYAITSQAYSFWTNLQKNTEDLGTIFGSLPVNVTGNFTCITDPTLPVLGFFSSTNVQHKRIFVNNRQLPRAQSYDPFYADCESYDVDADDAFKPTVDLFLYQTLTGYKVSTSKCADCRLHNGTLTVPPFW